MSVVTSTRRATYDEVVREMDRRGAVIEALEGEVERLRNALALQRDDRLSGLRKGQRDRIAASIAHLRETGHINRADIMRIGEVSMPQASVDLGIIMEQMPGLIQYDRKRKCYVLTEGEK